VERWRKSLKEFTDPEDALVIASLPLGEFIEDDERDVLKEWVQDGGRLILIGHYFPVKGGISGLPDAFDLRIEEEGMEPESIMFNIERGERVVPPVQPTAYTRGVSGVATMTVTTVGVDDPEAVPHIADATGPLCVSLPVGRGRVTLVSADDVGSNRMIDHEDNFAFLLNLLTEEAGAGVVWLDEFHHGYEEEPEAWGGIRESRAAPVFVQILILGVVGVLAAGRRFGPVRPVKEEKRRQTAEHVDCVAGLYETARARSTALSRIYGRFRVEAARLAGLSQATGTEEVAVSYAGKFGYNPDDLFDIMRRCESLEGRDVGERDLVRLVRGLDRFSPRRR
jgi:hypothetical protein